MHFLALSLAVFWHRVTWPYQERAGGLGSCLPRPPGDWTLPLSPVSFSLTDKRQGERSHRTQPSRVKQFQLWLLMNFFFFFFWGGEEGKSIGLCFRCGYSHRAVSALIFHWCSFQSGGVKRQLFRNLANYSSALNSSHGGKERCQSSVMKGKEGPMLPDLPPIYSILRLL